MLSSQREMFTEMQGAWTSPPQCPIPLPPMFAPGPFAPVLSHPAVAFEVYTSMVAAAARVIARHSTARDASKASRLPATSTPPPSKLTLAARRQSSAPNPLPPRRPPSLPANLTQSPQAGSHSRLSRQSDHKPSVSVKTTASRRAVQRAAPIFDKLQPIVTSRPAVLLPPPRASPDSGLNQPKPPLSLKRPAPSPTPVAVSVPSNDSTLQDAGQTDAVTNSEPRVNRRKLRAKQPSKIADEVEGQTVSYTNAAPVVQAVLSAPDPSVLTVPNLCIPANDPTIRRVAVLDRNLFKMSYRCRKCGQLMRGHRCPTKVTTGSVTADEIPQTDTVAEDRTIDELTIHSTEVAVVQVSTQFEAQSISVQEAVVATLATAVNLKVVDSTVREPVFKLEATVVEKSDSSPAQDSDEFESQHFVEYGATPSLYYGVNEGLSNVYHGHGDVADDFTDVGFDRESPSLDDLACTFPYQ